MAYIQYCSSTGRKQIVPTVGLGENISYVGLHCPKSNTNFRNEILHEIFRI